VKQHEGFDQPDELNEQGESLAQLEQYLTHALRRVDAPKGFAERTLARAREGSAPRGKLLVMPTKLRAWTSGAIAAALVAGIFVGEQLHVRRQREKAEEAQQQFEAAMRITGETLDQTRMELRRAGVSMGQD
jgi:hypothetical protein